MAAQLKSTTQQSHQALEGFLIPVIKNVSTVAAYVRLLKMFYGYYKPVEEAIDVFPVSHDLPDYDQRRKADLIMNDLKTLNEETVIPLCSAIPVLGTIEEAFGAMYVLEGSTLGGLIITKILQRNLQLPGTNGFTFFSGYGKDTGRKWAFFKEVLDTYCSDTDKYNRISFTANDTFIQLKKWAELTYRYECTKEKL